jgi:hypothetical protein
MLVFKVKTVEPRINTNRHGCGGLEAVLPFSGLCEIRYQVAAPPVELPVIVIRSRSALCSRAASSIASRVST